MIDINFSYDYEDLIQKFMFDCLAEGVSENDEIRVIREIREDLDGYNPIIDYIFEFDEEELLEVGTTLKFVSAKNLLNEMTKMNEIFK